MDSSGSPSYIYRLVQDDLIAVATWNQNQKRQYTLGFAPVSTCSTSLAVNHNLDEYRGRTCPILSRCHIGRERTSPGAEDDVILPTRREGDDAIM